MPTSSWAAGEREQIEGWYSSLYCKLKNQSKKRSRSIYPRSLSLSLSLGRKKLDLELRTPQPAEDLILEGSERSVIRVRAGTPYSCLMLKNQRFSSLFRHYAKHHGLRKDDLAYYFTEELQNEDTPETVFLLVSARPDGRVTDTPRTRLVFGGGHGS